MDNVKANLGLATTRELLEEIQTRGEFNGISMMSVKAENLLNTLPRSMLEYKTYEKIEHELVDYFVEAGTNLRIITCSCGARIVATTFHDVVWDAITHAGNNCHS